jgi:CRP/FNR family transcriptional regulator, cyclic AMP receptor protein
MAKPVELAVLLGTNTLFSGLGTEALRTIAALCHLRQLPSGQVLFVKGDPGDALYGVRRGQIRIEIGTATGQRLTIEMFGPGDAFGEIALLDGRPRTADAVAAENCELFVLPRSEFLQYLEHDSRLAVRIIELLCGRLRQTNDNMEATIFLPLRARLARRLGALAEDFGTELHITQEELGALLGVARESVNRQLQEWRRNGIVQLGRGQIYVLDVRQLAREAGRA